MSAGLERDTLFVGLTRPQMFAGVTYSFFVANVVIATELFLIFKSLWAIAIALALHGLGVLLCLKVRANTTTSQLPLMSSICRKAMRCPVALRRGTTVRTSRTAPPTCTTSPSR